MEQCSFGRFCRLGGVVKPGQPSVTVDDRVSHRACADEARVRFNALLAELDIPLAMRQQIGSVVAMIDRAITGLDMSSTGTLLIDGGNAGPSLN